MATHLDPPFLRKERAFRYPCKDLVAQAVFGAYQNSPSPFRFNDLHPSPLLPFFLAIDLINNLLQVKMRKRYSVDKSLSHSWLQVLDLAVLGQLIFYMVGRVWRGREINVENQARSNAELHLCFLLLWRDVAWYRPSSRGQQRGTKPMMAPAGQGRGKKKGPSLPRF